jgi:hypothetical protein
MLKKQLGNKSHSRSRSPIPGYIPHVNRGHRHNISLPFNTNPHSNPSFFPFHHFHHFHLFPIFSSLSTHSSASFGSQHPASIVAAAFLVFFVPEFFIPAFFQPPLALPACRPHAKLGLAMPKFGGREMWEACAARAKIDALIDPRDFVDSLSHFIL